MIRMLLLGLVVVMSTLGGSYAAVQMSRATPAHEGQSPERAEIIKLEPVSVPVVRGGKIQGYVIGRFAFSAGGNDVRKIKDELVLHVTEALFTSTYEEEGVDFTALKIVDLDKLVARSLAKANTRIGRPAIGRIFVENINFLAHDAVRCQPAK